MAFFELGMRIDQLALHYFFLLISFQHWRFWCPINWWHWQVLKLKVEGFPSQLAWTNVYSPAYGGTHTLAVNSCGSMQTATWIYVLPKLVTTHYKIKIRNSWLNATVIRKQIMKDEHKSSTQHMTIFVRFNMATTRQMRKNQRQKSRKTGSDPYPSIPRGVWGWCE